LCRASCVSWQEEVVVQAHPTFGLHAQYEGRMEEPSGRVPSLQQGAVPKTEGKVGNEPLK